MSAASTPASLITHILTMPRWQKVLLCMASVATVAGFSGQVTGWLRPAQNSTQVQPTSEPRGPGFVENQKSSNEPVAAEEPSLVDRLSPHATRIGVSFIVGFVLGWAFRVFVKTMAMIAALATAVFLGLSYFNVMNIDFSRAEKQYDSSKTWLVDQAGRLKDSVKTHLPNSGATFLGMFVGFRRKS